MKKFTFLLLFACIGFSAHSQTLSPTVISSSGGFYSNSSGMLSFTVAEMTMVQTFTSSGNILMQGFQQPEDLSVGINEIPVASGELLIYPNPTNGSFTLSFQSNNASEASIRIYKLAGQVVLEKQLSQSAGLNTINFDISAYSQGMYILQLATTNAKGEKNSSYHKINLVY